MEIKKLQKQFNYLIIKLLTLQQVKKNPKYIIEYSQISIYNNNNASFLISCYTKN